MTITSYIDHRPHAATDTFSGTYPTKAAINHWPETGDFAVTVPALKGYIDHFPQTGDY